MRRVSRVWLEITDRPATPDRPVPQEYKASRVHPDLQEILDLSALQALRDQLAPKGFKE